MSGNDGLRFVIDRRGGNYWWSFTDLGEEHKGNRGYSTIAEAAEEADQYRRQLDLARHFKVRKEPRLFDAGKY